MRTLATGGPVFPALFHGRGRRPDGRELPGFHVTPAVAVCMGAAVVAVLRLPLSAVAPQPCSPPERGSAPGR